MRKYFIYLIENEFADYFYGRENKFFELFAANHNCTGELKEIIQKQIDYITKPLPYYELHRHLSYYVQQKHIQIKGKVYRTSKKNSKERAELMISERCLQLHAWGGFESESLFFEVLRKFDGRFLAIDIENDRYGWIKPIKERKYV